MEVRDPLKIQLQRLEVGMVEEGVEAGKAWEGQAARWEGRQRAGGKWLSLYAAAATNSSQLLGHELGDRARMGSSVGLRDSPLHLRRVQLGVGIGGVAIAAPPAAEHHVATVDGALVHLPQMHRAEVDLEGALVAEGLHADVALYTLLPCGRTDKRRAQVVRHGVVAVAAPAPPALLLLVLPPIGVVNGAASAAGIAVGQLVQ